jgi:hypothetical protein
MRLWECGCEPRPARVASDDLRATCDTCHTALYARHHDSQGDLHGQALEDICCAYGALGP